MDEQYSLADEVVYYEQVDDGRFGTNPIARSPKWQNKRLQIVKHHPYCAWHGRTCRLELQVHHILPFHLYPELELVDSNLVVLCRDIHFAVGHLCDYQAYNPKFLEWLRDLQFRTYGKK